MYTLQHFGMSNYNYLIRESINKVTYIVQERFEYNIINVFNV